MNTNSKLFKNGYVTTSQGSKSVLFETDATLAFVVTSIESGKLPERGTFQVEPEDGMISANCTWSRSGKDVEYYIEKFSGGKWVRFNINDEASLWQLLRQRHSWLDSFLEPMGRGGVWLPFNVVPREEYLTVKAKLQKRAVFEATYGVKITDDILISPKEGLKYQPRPLDIDLAETKAYVKIRVGSGVNINQEDHFYLSNGQGSSIPVKMDKEVDWVSNYAYQKGQKTIGQTLKDALDFMGVKQRSYAFLIRLREGAYVRDLESYGIAVDVWSMT